MNTLLFIVLIIFGASLVAAAILVLAVIMSSRSTAKLAERYPEIYSDEALADAAKAAEESRQKENISLNTKQITAH